MRALIVIATALASSSPALAGPLTCSTWQGIRTCQSPGGYVNATPSTATQGSATTRASVLSALSRAHTYL
jgi:hypothetical protein